MAFAACVGVTLAAVLFARGAAALLARPAARKATLAVLLAIPAAAALRGIAAHLTRASFARWWTAYPVTARVSVARVPAIVRPSLRAMEGPEEPWVALTPSLRANRVSYREFLGDGTWPAITLRVAPASGSHEPTYADLWCPDARASLVVRVVASPDRALVACEDPRTGLPWPVPRDRDREASLIEARGYFAHVYVAEALGVAAPPPWATGGAGLGVLAALATLAVRRRAGGQAAGVNTPYRAAPVAEGAADDHGRGVARDAFAVALAAQAAAPLVLAAWSRLVVFR